MHTMCQRHILVIVVCVCLSADMHMKHTNCYPVFAQFLTCKTKKKMAKEVFLLYFTYILIDMLFYKSNFLYLHFFIEILPVFLVFVIKLYIHCHQNLVFSFIFLIKKVYIFSCLVLIYADFIKKILIIVHF